MKFNAGSNYLNLVTKSRTLHTLYVKEMEMKLNFPSKFFLLITYTWLIQHTKFMECI